MNGLENVLIAGGTGLIGANLTALLRELGADPVATRFSNTRPDFNDLPRFDFTSFDDCLKSTKGRNALVIAAALSFGAAQNKANPTGATLPNLKIITGLLEAAARNGIKKVVMLSSSTVYQPANYPIAENQLDLATPVHDAYKTVGNMYRYLEQLATSYGEIYGQDIYILRPTSVYGPYDSFDPHKSNVIPALIRRACDGESPFSVWGSPDVVRDFIYVKDVVTDITTCLTDDTIPTSTPINISSGTPVTIGQTVNMVLEACDHKADVQFDTSKPTTIPYRAVDNTLYKELFGSMPRTPLIEGLKATRTWYQAEEA
ncbi:NAD-dependent epimerase/dehydratase family protein [Pseudodesulfovibrio sp.]|nr:NAD-dependent epimerase/dehydratase family protein [Pseudodesulfovibrio sp.]